MSTEYTGNIFYYLFPAAISLIHFLSFSPIFVISGVSPYHFFICFFHFIIFSCFHNFFLICLCFLCEKFVNFLVKKGQVFVFFRREKQAVVRFLYENRQLPALKTCVSSLYKCHCPIPSGVLAVLVFQHFHFWHHQ